ncbi:MAG: crossover junction endodeoxyribonuclease RuvC [Bacteroides sp.]|nr:MAG: crossover junction endodeoxyribonuclease RuvC [Bacteroides sp.]
MNKIILGIDPGTYIMGYGLIESYSDKIQYIKCGYWSFQKKHNIYIRVQNIYINVKNIIKEYNPCSIAIESPFYGKNVKVTSTLNMVLGAVIAASVYSKSEIFQYSPTAIKQSITGNGKSNKLHVKYILQNIINVNILSKLDSTDALATAVCHHIKMCNNFI